MSLSARRFSLLLALFACAAFTSPADAAERGKRKKAAPASARRPPRTAPPVVKVKPQGSEELSDSSSEQTSGSPPSRGPTRIDFDDRLIQGQTNKSGAVYLYDRKELKQRSMVKMRESFREEIVDTVYDR